MENTNELEIKKHGVKIALVSSQQAAVGARLAVLEVKQGIRRRQKEEARRLVEQDRKMISYSRRVSQ